MLPHSWALAEYQTYLDTAGWRSHALEKIRGKAKAVKRIQELAAQVKEKYPGKELVGLTHAMVPGEAQALADAIKKIGFDERYRPDRPHNPAFT